MTPTAQVPQEKASLVSVSWLAHKNTVTFDDGVGAEDQSLSHASRHLGRLPKGEGLAPTLRILGERTRFLYRAGDDLTRHP